MIYNTNMSKRTKAIYECLENLDKLRKRIEFCHKNAEDFLSKINQQNTDKPEKLENSKVFIHELNDIEFQFNQELKTLRFWFDSLYRYNGKSTSLSKKTASAKNGQKGGRPPKEISIMKKRISTLEDEIIPELNHKIVMEDSNEKLKELHNLLETAETELTDCKIKINQWMLNKNKSKLNS